MNSALLGGDAEQESKRRDRHHRTHMERGYDFAEPVGTRLRNLTGAEKICKSDFMKIRISATEAARSFSELMNRVHYRGESFVVELGGKPICEILPAKPPKFSGGELANLLRSLPKPDEEYLAVVGTLVAKQSRVKASGWPR